MSRTRCGIREKWRLENGMDKEGHDHGPFQYTNWRNRGNTRDCDATDTSEVWGPQGDECSGFVTPCGPVNECQRFVPYRLHLQGLGALRYPTILRDVGTQPKCMASQPRRPPSRGLRRDPKNTEHARIKAMFTGCHRTTWRIRTTIGMTTGTRRSAFTTQTLIQNTWCRHDGNYLSSK
jgi:hypothetical protein